MLCEAGNKARSSGAHKMGLVYFKSAIQLLDKNAWDPVNYGRTYSLYTNAVSLSWVVGDYEVTEQILDIIFENTQDPIDRMAAHRIQHKYLFSKQMHDEGSDALRCCLKELDFKDYIPKNNKEELDVEYHKIKSMLDKVGLENISSIGPSTDVRVNSIMIILEEMCLVSYWLGNKLEMYYAACKMAELTLTYGLASVSGISLVLVGLAAAELYDQYSFGEELGSTGVSLCETEGSNTEKGHCQFVYATFLLMWKHHFKETIGWYRSSRRLSLSSGDRIYASLSFIYIANSTFFCSSTLTDTLIEAEACYDETYNWSPSSNSNILIMGIIRTCKALQGQTYYNNPEEIFDGDDGFNDKHFVSESCKQSPSMNVTLNFYDSYRMLPLVLYGHYEYAISMGYHCIRNMHYHPSHRHTRLVCMLQSLAIIEKLRSEKLDEKALNFYKENIETNQAYIYTWVENSRINYITWYTLVEAERTSLTSDIAKTCRLYEDAINYAREGDWYLDLCICHEYAGAFYDRVGMKNVAYGLIKKASSLYLSHGSYGKVHQLASKYNTLFDEFDDTRVESYDTGIQTDPLPYTNTQNTWSISSMANINTINDPYVSETIPPLTTEQTLLTLDILDMASILKSSQVMSSEVKFDGLLKSMMTIVLENSGADCGAVIVKDEKYGMCAYGSQQDGPMTFDPPKQLSDEDPLISSRIIHHTINTGESIFINNVEQDARFAVGEWYERSKNKSVICMPIIHKAALVGCLMIEGATGIFTQRHVTVLSLLCQQMGISITNAFLFKSVQRVTMANMR